MKNYEQIIDFAKDRRSINIYKKDMGIGNYNGRLALRGYTAHLYATTGLVHYGKYYKDEYWDSPEKIKIHHDADIDYPDGTRVPFSVKTTVKNPPLNPFPLRYSETKDIMTKHGNILIATSRKFIVFPAQLCWGYPVEPVEHWNFKKCFMIDLDNFEWTPFLNPLKFKEYY